MAITSEPDKDAFYKRIRGSPYIRNNIGIEGLSDAETAKIILKRRTNDHDELTSKSRYIMIFEGQPGNAIGPYEYSCMEINVLMPADKQFLADDTMEQIIALCNPQNEDGWKVNGRYIDKVTTVGELTAAPGFYRCGCRVYYYSSTARQIKTQLFKPN